MKRYGKFLIPAMLALLMGVLIALFAGASEKTGVLTVVYPNGVTQTFEEGETVTKPAVPSSKRRRTAPRDLKRSALGKAYVFSIIY